PPRRRVPARSRPPGWGASSRPRARPRAARAPSSTGRLRYGPASGGGSTARIDGVGAGLPAGSAAAVAGDADAARAPGIVGLVDAAAIDGEVVVDQGTAVDVQPRPAAVGDHGGEIHRARAQRVLAQAPVHRQLAREEGVDLALAAQLGLAFALRRA